MAQESIRSIQAERRIRVRNEVLGHLRRQFLGDYRFLRKAGVDSEKALQLCMQRYGKRAA